MTNEKLIQIIETLSVAPVVARINKWEGGKVVRYYVHLTERAPGDCKIWIDPSAGKIVCDFGRKGCSPAYSQALGAFEAAAAQFGEVVRAYRGSPDFVVQVGEG